MTASYFFESIIVPIGLFVGMAAAQEFGARLRHRHTEGDSKKDMDGLGSLDAAVFGLMGLLLAFAFSGAAARFDHRRELVVQEANDIGTAWLRLALLPESEQPALRDKFREYLDSRISTYVNMTDQAAYTAALAKSNALQGEIWTLAVAGASKTPNTAASMLLLPTINDMFDTVTERSGSLLMHPPGAVFALLIVVLVLCSMLAGYRVGSSDRWHSLHRLSFVVILAITYYLIVDLEYPRLGFITVDSIDQMLVVLRQQMN